MKNKQCWFILLEYSFDITLQIPNFNKVEYKFYTWYLVYQVGLITLIKV